MAIARVEVLAGLTLEQKRERVQAVRGALVAALQVPDDDPTVRLIEMDANAVVLPGGASPRFTVVQVTLFSGRSLDTKRRLYRAVCSSLERVGVAPSDVLIVLVESSRENWGVMGGTPASEVELGFEVNL
jgi:phenylpyruvate tautomerase PptA (4-oxalocrotonate tautomerase family)